jgi:GrpB-like predicted nucleotidyltransferase (UPF0157 family)
METLQERIQRVVREDFRVVEYNPVWPRLFEQEKRHLLNCLSNELIGRIEHFGSTAIPGMAAKPIVDMLIEVVSLEETKKRIVPVLEAIGYDYFWRPAWGDDAPPFYAWFIKRNAEGQRTHHLHMVEHDFELWDRLMFRDYLMEHPDVAQQYRDLKFGLMRRHPGDRIAYAKGKTEFIVNATRKAKSHYERLDPKVFLL